MVILRAKMILNFTNLDKVPFLFKLVHRRRSRDLHSLFLLSVKFAADGFLQVMGKSVQLSKFFWLVNLDPANGYQASPLN